MESSRIHCIVNGMRVDIDQIGGEMLADMLRDRLGLTGTKIGCNEAECGACTVLVDGEPVLSCAYPAAKANGREIVTIEGIAFQGRKADDELSGKLHPLQQAFIRYGAVQCGYCIPGQIVTSYALLQKNPEPTEAEIKYALKDTLCRCGCYPAIINAIQAASRAIKTGTAVVGPSIPTAAHPGNVVGTIYHRPDSFEKVTGKARYTADLHFDGMLHARVKRAMVASAIVKRIDVAGALRIPGVRAVLTADDIPGKRVHGLVIHDWPILVGIGEVVRTVGDAVAIIAADTREAASLALDQIKVDFDALPVINDPLQAQEENALRIHPTGNLLKHIKVRKGNIQAGFDDAEVILEHSIQTPMHDHAFIEPECSIARPIPDGRMEIYVGSQIPYSDRSQVAEALGWEEERVHVIGMLVGGGFGGKEDIAGQIHAALLANVTQKPVKLLFDRQESLLVHPKRHATKIRVKIGARKDGRLTAVETELHGDTGAYASLGEKVMTRATTHSSGPYDIPHVKIDCYAMYTNNPPAGAFRGFGVLQSAFAIESAMDILAEQLGIDPIEIRRKNALRIGSTTNTGQILKDSAGLIECIDRVSQQLRNIAGDQPFGSKGVPGAEHLRRAWGFAVAYKNTGLGGGAPDKAGAEVELYPDGHFEIRTASAELGQGLPTVLKLIAAEVLHQSPDRINTFLSDTDLTPDGGPTTASRQTYVTGNAVRGAAEALVQLVKKDLSERYDISPDQVRFIEGLAQVGDQQISLAQVAKMILAEGRKPLASYTYWAPATRPLGQGGDMHFAYSFAAQAAEVEVNIRTGEVQVIHVISANDVGFAINPLGLQGQIEGGVIMGIGHALTENFILDQGKVVTDRLARYRIPSIMLTPKITSIVVEHPTREGPFGAKGVGEIVLIPTVPAITNAIYNAVGVRVTSLPVDQEQILANLNLKT
ncbi:MAG TPA: molybdopterin cofactor-binding domain-containing protein [Anaerolineaceae bacterium]